MGPTHMQALCPAESQDLYKMPISIYPPDNPDAFISVITTFLNQFDKIFAKQNQKYFKIIQ